MTDFVKVNFQFNNKQVKKKNIIRMRISNTEGRAIIYILREADGRILPHQITREEYDRLCKELGVE